jgi:hypothetical protein
MAFPTNPTNGQAATVNDITYVYNSALGVWESSRIQTSANLTVNGNVVAGGTFNRLTITPSGNQADLSTISTITANAATITGNLVVGGNINMGGSSYSSLFYNSTRTISANTTIGALDNSMSVGPITIANGVTVTVASGGEWSIV